MGLPIEEAGKLAKRTLLYYPSTIALWPLRQAQKYIVGERVISDTNMTPEAAVSMGLTPEPAQYAGGMVNNVVTRFGKPDFDSEHKIKTTLNSALDLAYTGVFIYGVLKLAQIFNNFRLFNTVYQCNALGFVIGGALYGLCRQGAKDEPLNSALARNFCASAAVWGAVGVAAYTLWQVCKYTRNSNPLGLSNAANHFICAIVGILSLGAASTGLAWVKRENEGKAIVNMVSL